MSQQINGVGVPGWWMTKEYVTERQARTYGEEPRFNYCGACGDPYRKKHYCVFAQAGEPT